jgi:CRP-like cAMP-binding protein
MDDPREITHETRQFRKFSSLDAMLGLHHAMRLKLSAREMVFPFAPTSQMTDDVRLMIPMLELVAGHKTQSFVPGDVVMEQGGASGRLMVLIEGEVASQSLPSRVLYSVKCPFCWEAPILPRCAC